MALWKAARWPHLGASHRRSKPAARCAGSGESLRSATEGAKRTREPSARAAVLLPLCWSAETIMTSADSLKRTPLADLHRELARKWCRSPVTRCRCSIRPGSSPSICTPASMPACSTSRIWGRSGLKPTMSMERRRRSSAGPGRHRWRCRPGGCATRCSLNRAGGILDDLMVARVDGEHLFLVVNAGQQGGGCSRICGQTLAGRRDRDAVRSRIAGVARTCRGRCLGALRCPAPAKCRS